MEFVPPLKNKYKQFKFSSFPAELSVKYFLQINIKIPTIVAL